MKKLIATIAMLLLAALIALAGAGQGGGARSTELVKCSSTTPTLDSLGRAIDLTGTWTGSDRQSYYLRQVGGCLWWSSATRSSTAVWSVFFGTVFRSGVAGQWADVRSRTPGTHGTLKLRISASGNVLLRSGSAGPVKYLRKTR